jgi:hypothetical protein
MMATASSPITTPAFAPESPAALSITAYTLGASCLSVKGSASALAAACAAIGSMAISSGSGRSQLRHVRGIGRSRQWSGQYR